MIKGDFSKCFDNINHLELMKVIEQKIKDRRFTNLIFKSLKAGYMERQVSKYNIIGITQGTLLSPMLTNIYLHYLDKFMENMAETFNKGIYSRRSTESNRVRFLMTKALNLGAKEEYITLRKHRDKYLTSYAYYKNKNFKRLAYVRYADD